MSQYDWVVKHFNLQYTLLHVYTGYHRIGI